MMEGEGAKGVLTILQGLNSSDLVIALGTGPREEVDRRQSKPRLAAVKPLQPQKSSVHTNTEVREATTSRHVQICDDRFTSCYQVAHCSVSPTSPPVPLSEFPPQRQNPIYNGGNFEVGGQGSWQAIGPSRANHFRGGLTWPDRGSVYCNKSSRDIDAFAHSLRKYPPGSPDRSVSSDLVERLLKYTQAKYAQKTARTKSMRSLPNNKSPDRRATHKLSGHLPPVKDTHSPDTSPNRKTESSSRKDVSPPKKEDSPRICKRDRGTTSDGLADENRGSRKRSRNFRLRSPVSDRNIISRNESPFSLKYDYLKAGQACEPLELGVDEINRQMRSVLRQFYKPRPLVFQVCPKLQQRYLQHKKTCPVKNAATWMTDEDMDADEASSSRLCRFLESINITCGPSDTDLAAAEHYEQQRQSFCHCTQTPECHCDPKTDKQSNDKSTQSNGKYVCQPGDELCKESCECVHVTDEEYYSNKIDAEVAKWLNFIPVQSNERPEYRRQRGNMVSDLAETIKQLPDDEDFEYNARGEIEKCVDNMPMWYPGSKKDEEQIKKHLVRHLLNRITRIPRKANKLRDAVKEFVNSINFTEDIDKNVIVDNFMNTLRFLVINAPKDDEVLNELLVYEATEMLNELPIQYRGNKSIILNRLATKLADDVKHLLKTIDKDYAKTSLKDTLKDIISEWFDDVGEINDNLPNNEVIKRHIYSLASKLDNLQSQGVDDVAINKMEEEICKVLEDIDTPNEAIDDLSNNLLDKVTDAFYANGKDKFENLNKKETLKELKDWLQNVEAVDKLSPVQQYKLVKDIVQTIQGAIDEENKDYHENILEELAKHNIHVDPVNVGIQMDKIINKLKLLPEKIKKCDLIADLQNDFNDAINILNLSEYKKDNLKENTANIIAECVEASSLATTRDIDDMKEMLLEEIFDTLENLPQNIQIDLKNELDDILDRKCNKMKSAHEKDSVKYALQKEINYVIDKEPIPDEEKNDLKYNIKHVLNENFDQPYSYHVKDLIKSNLDHLLNNAQMGKERKSNLINKLSNTVDKKLDHMPKQSMKEHMKNKTLKDLNKVIDKSQISDVDKDKIKEKFTNTLNEHFDQPFSTDVKDVILQDIKEIIDKFVKPRSLKHELIRKLTGAASENLDELPDQTVVDYTKEKIVKDIHDFLDNISLGKDLLNDLKKHLEFTLSEFLDRPYTRDQRNKLIESIEKIITESDVPSDEKQRIIDKLINITSKKLDQMSYQTPEEYAKETIVRDVMNELNKMSLSGDEKRNLIERVDDLVQESLRTGHLGEGRDEIKEGIVNIIRESSAPHENQDKFICKTLHAVSKILDESYYDDHEREQLREFYDMIDKTPMHTAKKNLLKPKTKRIVDDHTLDPEFENVKGMIKEALDLVETESDVSIGGQDSKTAIDETVIDDIISAIKSSPISKSKKSLLENKVNTLLENLSKHEDLDLTIGELEKIIEEIPQSSHDKKVLKSKLAMISSKDPEEINKQLKNVLIKDFESAVDLISLGKEKDSDLKSKIKDLVDSLDEPISGNVKDKIKGEVMGIIDKTVHSKDKKKQIRDRINSIIDKLPTHIQDKNIIHETLLTRIGEAIDGTPIRQHIKKDINSQIRDIISQDLKLPLQYQTKERIISDINNVINEAPVTEYQKKDLKHKVAKVLDHVPKISDSRNTVVDEINNLLDEESMSKVKKSELKKKMQKHLNKFDESLTVDERNKIIDDVLQVIDDTVMPKDKKDNLKVKLENVLSKYVLSPPSIQKHDNVLLDTLDDSVNKVLNDALIPQSTKGYLKRRMKDALSKIVMQPITDNIDKSINREFSQIMQDVALSKAEKDILKKNLAGAVSDKIGEPQPKLEKVVMRDSLLQDIDLVLDKIHVPKDRRQDLELNLQGLLDDITHKPETSNALKKVGEEISSIIAEAPVSIEKRAETQNKVTGMVKDCLKMTLSDYKKYKQVTDKTEEVMEEFDSMLNPLQMDTEQKINIRYQLKDLVNETLAKPLNNDTVEIMNNHINDIITETKLPKHEKAKLIKQLRDILYDKARNMADMDSKSHQLDEKSKIDAEESKKKHVIQNKLNDIINSIVDQSPMRNHQKVNLKQQLKAMVAEDLVKPLNDDTQQVLKDHITEIVLTAPIPKDNKTQIIDKLADKIDNIGGKDIAKNIQEDIVKMKPDLKESARQRPKKSKDERENAMLEIDSIVGQLQIPKELKAALKQKLIDKADENLTNKPKSAKKRRLVSPDVDIDRHKTNRKVKIIAEDSGKNHSQAISTSKNKNAMHEIDSVIGRLQIPNELKNVLKEKLTHKTNGNRRIPTVDSFDDSHKTDARGKVDKSGDTYLKQSVHKDKPAADTKTLTEGISPIIDQLEINIHDKAKLKHQLEDLVNDKLNMPENSDTVQYIKNKINNIISEAPITKDKKDKTIKELADVLDTKVSQSINYKDRPVSEIKTAVTKGIDSIVNELDLNNYQKNNLKRQLDDMIDKNSDKPIDGETMQYIKQKIGDIISEAPISKDKKGKITNKLTEMIDNKAENIPSNVNKYKPVTDVKVTVTQGIDSIVDQLDMNNRQKANLKHQFDDMMNEVSNEPINDDTINYIRNKINNIVSEAPIPKDKRVSITKKITNMVGKKLKAVPDKTVFTPTPIQDIKAAVTQEMDSIVDQLSINSYQKTNLKHQLGDTMKEIDNKPINEDTMQYIKNKINNIVSEAPIPKVEKAKVSQRITDVVNNKIDTLPDKNITRRHQPVADIKAAITQDMDSIVEQLDIKDFQKSNLKHQLGDAIEEIANEPINEDTMQYIKNKISNIVAEAPIPKEQKKRITNKITNAVDTKLETLPKSKIVDKYRPVADAKAAVAQEMTSIVDQLDINGYQKANLKHQLNDMVAEIVDEPVNDDTINYIKNKINNIVSEAPISKDKKAKITKRMTDMVGNKLKPVPDKTVYKSTPVKNIKAAVTQEMDSIVDQLSIDSYQKTNLKHQLDDTMKEIDNKPINEDTMQYIKNKINNIVSEAPIPKVEKAKVLQRITDVVNNKIDTPVADMKAAITQDMDSIVEQLDINNFQKSNLKHQLGDAIEEIANEPINEDTMQYIKNKISNIVAEAPIPKEQKKRITNKITNAVDKKLETLPKSKIIDKYRPVADAKAEVAQEMASIVDQLDINGYQKANLKHQLNDMMSEISNESINDNTMNYIQNKINDIVSEAPIPKGVKAKIVNKITDAVDVKVKSLPGKKTTHKHQPEADIKAEVTDGMDSIVDQLDITNYQKSNLKHQLEDMMDEISDQPVNKDTILFIKNKINDIVAEAPIPKDKKAKITKRMTDMINDKVEPLPGKTDTGYKSKPVRNIKAVTDGMDSLVDQLDINSYQKAKLKHQLNDTMNEIAIKPVNDETMQYIKNKINTVISEAPVPRDKKAKLANNLINMVDDNVKPLPEKSKTYDFNPVSNIKKAVTEGIDNIVNQLELNNNQKANLKRELNSMVSENANRPIDDKTMLHIKQKIGDIISEAPIPGYKKAKITKNITDMVDNKVENLPNKTIKGKPVADVQPAITQGINSIVDQLNINSYQKTNLKHQLDDMLDEISTEPVNKDTVDYIKNKINDVVAKAPIPKVDKVKIAKRMTDIVNDKMELLPDKNITRRHHLVADIKAAITQDMDSIVDKLDINNYQKANLNRQFDDMMKEISNESINDEMMGYIKNKINNIVSEAPITKEQKREVTKRISDVVDDKVKSLPEKNIIDKYQPIANVKTAVTQEMDTIVDQLDISNKQKAKLKHQFDDMMEEISDEHVNGDTVNYIKDKINNIISESPIPKAEKSKITKRITDVVDNKVNAQPSEVTKYKPVVDVKEAVTQGMDSIVDQLDLNDYQKANLKHRFNDVVDEIANEPINDDTMNYIKNKINDIITEVPIPKAEKSKITKRMTDMIDNKVNDQTSKDIKYKPMANVKTDITQGMDSIVDQLDINNYQKANLKHQFNDMVDEIASEPINDDTMKYIKNKINDIVTEVPIPKAEKSKITKRITDMIDNKVTAEPSSIKYKPVANVKTDITQGMNSIVDKLDMNNYQKANLKHQINDVVDEMANEPINDDTINFIKSKINNIVTAAPMPKEERAKLTKNINDMVEDKVKSMPDKSMKYKPVADVKVAVTRDMDTIVNQLDINKYQKANLKHQLNDMLDEISTEPVTEDTVDYIKNKINDIVAKAPIPETQKEEVTNTFTNIVDRKVKPLPSTSTKYVPVTDVQNELQEGIASIVDHIEMNDYQRENLKRKLNNTLEENLEEPFNTDTIRNIKKKITDIISDAPISSLKKADIRKHISEMVDNTVESARPGYNISNNSFAPVQISSGDLGREKLSPISPIKRNAIMQEVDSTLEQMQIPAKEKTALKQKLKNKIDESLKEPLFEDTFNTTKENINSIIADAPISTAMKADIAKKMSKMVDKNFKPLAPLKKAKYNTDKIMTELEDDLEQLPIPQSEKNIIRHDLKHMLDENSQQPEHVIKEAIHDIITQSAIPEKKKAEIVKTMSDKVDRDIKLRGHDERGKKPDTVIIKNVPLDNINEMLKSLQIPSEEKITILSKINGKVSKYSDKPIGLDTLQLIKEDIGNVIAEAPMANHKKLELKNKILQQLNKNTEYLPNIDYSRKSYKKTKVAALRYENPRTSGKKSRAARSQEQDSKGGPSDDADKRTNDNNDSVLGDMLKAIDDLDVPSEEKANLKRKLLESHEDDDEEYETYDEDYDSDDSIEHVVGTRKLVAENISGILRDLAASKQMKKDLRGQMANVLDKEDDNAVEGHNKMLDKTGSVITGLPVSQDVKEKFMDQLAGMRLPSKSRISNSDTDDSLSEGPVTSTPKQGRKSWDEAKSLSAIGVDATSNYWQKIEDSINNWLDELPIHLDEETMNGIREGIARDIRDRQKYLKLNPDAMKSVQEELDNLQYQVMRRLSKVLDEDDMRVVMQAAGGLMQAMQAVKVPRSIKVLSDDSDEWEWESAEKVHNIVDHWIDQLPLDPRIKNSPEFKTLKEDLLSNLMERIEEMNNDPDILNNDALYEEILRDEVDKMISELPIDPDTIVKEKEALIQQLMASQRTVRAGKEGRTYKQQLKDTISKTLPLEDASPEKLASFEIMKGDVADAFISLHFSGGNEEQRKQLKNKIYDEVNKYCDNYLKKRPNEPVDREKIAEDLYAALKKVPVPPDESMRLEEEHIRIKDKINDWLKEIPLKEVTAQERLQIAQQVATLAKRLKDIERNDAQLSSSEVNAEMEKQIGKFLNKLPLKPGQEKQIDFFTKQLIAKLRSTEQARRIDESTRYSITPDDTLLGYDVGICPYYKSMLERQKQAAARRRMHPPCSLSKEDREHLERIRQRTCMTPDCLSSLLRGGKRNSYATPMVTETSSQTEQNLEIIGQRITSQPCPSAERNSSKPCPGVPPQVLKQMTSPQHTRGQFVESGSQIDIQPQVIIKEYYWDTADTSNIPPPEARHSTGSLRRQRYTVPYRKPAPCPGIRPQNSVRCSQHKSLQTCQDRRTGPSLPCTSSPYIPRPCSSRPSIPFASSPCEPSPCSSRPCSPSPSPCTPRPYKDMSQPFVPQQQSTPQNSFGQFRRDYEYRGPKRNGLQPEYPEYSGSRYSRKERVIELGSLDDLRRPSQRKRAEDYGWSCNFPEDDFWGTPQSGHEVDDDSEIPCSNMPYVREKKEERVRCKCKEKVIMARRHPRQQCPRHSNIWSNCVDNGNNNLRRCSRCFGSHCPHPSYMYFKP